MSGIHRRRRKRTTSDEQYAQMLVRMLRRWQEDRAGSDPVVALRYARRFQELVDGGIDSAIYHGLAAGGSPTVLAEALGVSRQAIYKRAGPGVGAGRPQAVTGDLGAVQAHPRELPPGASDG